MYPPKPEQPEQQELIDRLMFAQANEAARCYEEKVLRSVADANIGSIFGWGFAPFQGGALQFINALGPKKFVDRARELAKKYGARFEPAGVVVRMAGEGKGFLTDLYLPASSRRNSVNAFSRSSSSDTSISIPQ
jgi:3-hydroxyacyl-CoA dehydrogenase/enoyl-CoA hydratase/3-hydroxybutyryl-CoA epimerase